MLAAVAAAPVAALLHTATATTMACATASEVSARHVVDGEQLVAVQLSSSAADRLVAR